LNVPAVGTKVGTCPPTFAAALKKLERQRKRLLKLAEA
jgi:hypothetical protein